MLLADDFFADFTRIAVRNPIELGHQFHRPQIGRGVFVAIQAEGHVQRLLLVDFDFLINAAVAQDATHAGADVHLVIKIDVIWKPVNVNPRDGLTSREAVPYQLQARAGVLHLGVAIHAGLGGRDRGEGSFVNGGMAIEAIQTKLPGVQLMAVRDRLNRLVTGVNYGRVGELGVSGDRHHRAQSNDRTGYL